MFYSNQTDSRSKLENMSVDLLNETVEFSFSGIFRSEDGSILESVQITAPRAIQLIFNGYVFETSEWLKKIVRVNRTSYQRYTESPVKPYHQKSSLAFEFCDQYLDDGQHYHLASLIQRFNRDFVCKGQDLLGSKDFVKCLIRHGNVSQFNRIALVDKYVREFHLESELALRYLRQFSYVQGYKPNDGIECFPWIKSLDEYQIEQEFSVDILCPTKVSYMTAPEVKAYFGETSFYNEHYVETLDGDLNANSLLYSRLASDLNEKLLAASSSPSPLSVEEKCLLKHISFAVQVLANDIAEGTVLEGDSWAMNHFVDAVIRWPSLIEYPVVGKALGTVPKDGTFINDMLVGLCDDEGSEAYWRQDSKWYELPLLTYMVAVVVKNGMKPEANCLYDNIPEGLGYELVSLANIPETLSRLQEPRPVCEVLGSICE